jgi:hypothetical protein
MLLRARSSRESDQACSGGKKMSMFDRLNVDVFRMFLCVGASTEVCGLLLSAAGSRAGNRS